MPLNFNGTAIKKATFNGVELTKITFNGVEVWTSQVDAVVGGVLPSGVSLSVIYEYCNYGEWTTGLTEITGASITVPCSDFYQASRYYLGRVRFNGLSFTGTGQTVTIANTYYHELIAKDPDYEHFNNSAELFLYNLSTGGMTLLGNIRYDGTKTFAVPNDGQPYTLCIELCTWCGKAYYSTYSTISISSLYIS